MDTPEMPPASELLASGMAMAEVAARYPGSAIIEGALVLDPAIVYADDGNAKLYYEGLSAAEAAKEYVDSGDWGYRTETIWVDVHTWRLGLDEDGDEVRVDEESHSIALEVDEPECSDGQEHDWRAPYSVVGGIRENPGVWGHGGGVIMHEVCRHCGTYRVIDTWATDRETGAQGLRSVEYREADEASLAWVSEHSISVDDLLDEIDALCEQNPERVDESVHIYNREAIAGRERVECLLAQRDYLRDLEG